MAAQIGFLDKRIRPNLIKDLLFLHDLAGVFDQDTENF